MKIGEFVKLSSSAMKLLAKNEIKMSDYIYAELFCEYEKLIKDKVKVSYIVASLAEKYQISEASVYRILKRFKRTI